MAFDQNKPASSSTLSSTEIRNNFQHLKNAVSKEHNWNDSDPNASTHKLNIMSATVSGFTQRDVTHGVTSDRALVYDYTTGSGELTKYYSHTDTGIPAGTYTLQSLLQELVNRSHQHRVERALYNCNCDCGGN